MAVAVSAVVVVVEDTVVLQASVAILERAGVLVIHVISLIAAVEESSVLHGGALLGEERDFVLLRTTGDDSIPTNQRTTIVRTCCIVKMVKSM